MKSFLKVISIPLILLVIYLAMYVVWKLLGLPDDSELLVIVKDSFARYGPVVVFISALIEGFFLLGQYFPGGFVIFLGVISTGKDIPRAIEVVSIVCVAFFIAYTLNFWLGKYGWYKLLVKFGLKGQLEQAKSKLEKQGLNAVIFSYWEPNLASITATAAGILGFPLKKFSAYSLTGVVLWNIFWGTLVFLLGESAMNIVGMKWILIIFAAWVAVLLIKKYWFEKRNSIPEFGIKRENEERRDGGCGIVYDPSTKFFAVGEHHDGGFLRLFSGGVDEEEDIEKGVLREVTEESGLHDFDRVEKLAQAMSHYHNSLKNVNRLAFATCLLVILKSNDVKQVKLEEHEKFSLVWKTKDEILSNWEKHNENKDIDHWFYFFRKALARMKKLGYHIDNK